MNPNTNNPSEQPLTTGEKVKVGSAIAGMVLAAGGLAGVAAHEMISPDHGTSNQPGNVTVEFQNNGTAWDAAKEIKDTDADLRELAGEIKEQTDAQGDPGVQAGETAILPAADISKQALAEYVVPTTPTAEATPTETPKEVIVDDNDMVTPQPAEVVPDDTPVIEKPENSAEQRSEPATEPKSSETPQEVVPNDTPVMESPDQPEEVVPNDTPVMPAPEETTQPEQPQEVVPQDTPVIPQP